MFSECYSNSSGRDLATAAGAFDVKYGEIEDNGRTIVAFGHKTLTKQPSNGAYLDE